MEEKKKKKRIKIVTNNGSGLCVPLIIWAGGCITASEMWGWKN
jgi:hypothetical protein